MPRITIPVHHRANPLYLLCLLVVLSVGEGNAMSGPPGLHGIEQFACRGVPVEPGDTREEVIGKCGEPAWRDVRVETLEEEDLDNGLISGVTEEWIYEFGHDQLLEFLRFRDGRLVTLHTGNYGFGGNRSGDCDYGGNLALGDSKLEVVAKCGEPLAGQLGEDPSHHPGVEDRRAGILSSDEWRYNFGRERPVHYLSFRYGRLMEIRFGGFGS
ncbi:DUF2845 domain-containing protein [Geobacter sp. DSM 9736]|uniref:DUF2845 domain-containing protein n=1 Tax=Geobacter sp. DSM 9736 TaxID=1277350 RepID=UPI000B506601|nr:DUF2845 domain-containing protein [Geobacter sp. DSM 9736]SNB45213.1 Protein of unknown function [Geobacter sp. DSM 9736]